MNNTRHLTRRITRRGTTRTNTSLGKVEVEKQQPKQEQYNMNAIIIKNLSSENPSKGKINVYYSYIENQYKQVEDSENYLDILDIDESILHKEDTQAVSQEEYHTRKKKLKTQVRKDGEGIGELEVDSLRSMRNRLIYCERASETLQKKIINRECETIKLNRVNHDGIFHQWDRFDSYMSNFLHDKDKKRMEDEFKMKGKIGTNTYFIENGTNSMILKRVQKCYICFYPSLKMLGLKTDQLLHYVGIQNLKIYSLLDMAVTISHPKKRKKEKWKMPMMINKIMDIFMYFLSRTTSSQKLNIPQIQEFYAWISIPRNFLI